MPQQDPIDPGAAPPGADTERVGLLRAIEQLEGLMAALERSLLGERPVLASMAAPEPAAFAAASQRPADASR